MTERVCRRDSLRHSGTGATTSAPAATPGSAETPAQASTLVSGLVTQYSGAVLAPGADGAAAREAVLSGRALDAAKARVALAPAMTAEQKADLALKPETIAIGDHVVDRGPGAGAGGGIPFGAFGGR